MIIITNLLQNPKTSLLLFPIPGRRHYCSRKKLQPKTWLPNHRHSLKKLKQKPNPNFQVCAEDGSYNGGLCVNADEFLEREDLKFPVDLSWIRNLPPALTLRVAVEGMKEVVEKLKVDPPCSRSGVLRFQVPVPPSTKAINWLCCQQLSLRVFPQFYFSRKKSHDNSRELTSSNGALGVSGAGAAVCFHSVSPEGCHLMARYLSIDSDLIRAYGFLGINYNGKSSSMEKKPGSFYFFIPQVEISEYEHCSFLASTLVWDNSLSFTFGEAVQCLEKCLQQIRYIPPVGLNNQDMWMKNIFGDSEMNVNGVQMVNLDAEVLAQINGGVKCLKQEEMPTFDHYIFRHSASVSIGTDKFIGPRGISCSIKETSNINLVWASLIIEECVRLGLTYFCIAPGSRSSPLALSACSHPLTTCVSCIDERSLGFHAVGYGRGSHKPAVVITSSGTAVSNLLPSVVEASHDFVPLVILTADRPPELLEAGANQAIDQINHFGKFVRWFFNLPPPTDQIPARMVLTTVDSAAYRATQEPFGPVHINCPFREPLEDHPREWTLNCLSGLELWMSKEEPFTKYIKMQFLSTCNNFLDDVREVLDVIENADKGLLLVGAIHTEDEIWAAFILSKHLLWPVVCDVLSGLRLRRVLSSLRNIDDHFLFIDHMDQILLSDSVKFWVQPDVVVQIGSKITSKRISQLLEYHSPSYILVDKHPFRHDPSHIVTHRIQSTITEFAEVVLAIHLPRKPSRWSFILKALDKMIAEEISFLLHSESALTEPHVAHTIGEALQDAATLFIGNSMVIRDVDMYGGGWVKSCTEGIHLMSKWDLQFHGIQVSGNRGASGIDGLLSTAIGFAIGSNKKVLCVIGDVSFLHDTNGLAILNQSTRRKPMTIIVINNHGGAIFSLLPIADRTPPSVLNQYFYTSHDVSVLKLCSAHSVKHLLVRTKSELKHALQKSQKDQSDCVIEVESCIADNAQFHRVISKFACQAADQTLRVLLRFPFSENMQDSLYCKIQEVNYSSYRIQLCAPTTSSNVKDGDSRFYREGFILAISLVNGSVGFGEVAPTELHKEDLLDVEEQLRFLVHAMEGSQISCILPLLKGSFSHWIWRSLGILPSSVFPSVRCGLEMALLNAIAAQQDSCLSDLLSGCNSTLQDTQNVKEGMIIKRQRGVQICALVDSNGTPKEVAHVVSQLVEDGFTTIKLKVARRENPIEDAVIIQEIRQVVGYGIDIRADANRKWTYEDACQFGFAVKSYDLQYIEEPVCLEDDIIKFCEETGLPVALDETIDHLEGNVFNKLKEFGHPGIVAIVIKPSVVGGFEKALLIAKWAQLQGKMAVISSTFESSLSLSTYVQFAHYLERQNMAICKTRNRELSAPIGHGLGTYKWLKDDVAAKTLRFCVPPDGDTMEVSVKDSDVFLRCFQMNQGIIQRVYKGEEVRSYQLTVDCEGFSHLFKVIEAGAQTNNNVAIFLHGFLGTSQDWIPVMKAISATTRCISIDLPGHGNSQACWHMTKKSKQIFDPSVESVADILMKLICRITPGGVVLVGYSMGARIALYMALKNNEKIDGAVIISGSPGLRDEATRRARTMQDEAKAQYLMTHGLPCFLETWYADKLWKSLRDHPSFMKIVDSRSNHNDIQALAKSLSGLSIGRQTSLWKDLKKCRKPLLLITGEKDTKFKDISHQMCAEIVSCQEGGIEKGETLCDIVVVPDSGHAVHLENPLLLINAVRKFLTKLSRSR